MVAGKLDRETIGLVSSRDVKKVAAMLADIPLVSGDPIVFQAERFRDALLAWSDAVAAKGPALEATQDEFDRYRLVAELYAPALISLLARARLRSGDGSGP